MVSSILLLFTDPDGFFRREPKEWSDLKIPAVIVLISGILSAIAGYLVTRVLSGIFPEGMQEISSILPIMGFAAAAGALVTVFFMWAAYTAVFYIISMIFMGKGTFTRTLAAIGYGFLPTAIGGLIDLIILWTYLPGIHVSPVKDIIDIQSATTALTQSPVLQMTGLISIIFLLWSASIWIFGLRYSRELTLRNAAISVGLPILAYIVITLVFMGVFS
ncbi:MAG: YIP1 family protein [Methanomicrobiales archaeon]|nr:YIP1 family protein [Methanomicrobiales archaeon]